MGSSHSLRWVVIAPNLGIGAESEAKNLLKHVVMATRDKHRSLMLFTNDNDIS